jgi:hypothetical protein
MDDKQECPICCELREKVCFKFSKCSTCNNEICSFCFTETTNITYLTKNQTYRFKSSCPFCRTGIDDKEYELKKNDFLVKYAINKKFTKVYMQEQMNQEIQKRDLEIQSMQEQLKRLKKLLNPKTEEEHEILKEVNEKIKPFVCKVLNEEDVMKSNKNLWIYSIKKYCKEHNRKFSIPKKNTNEYNEIHKIHNNIKKILVEEIRNIY